MAIFANRFWPKITNIWLIGWANQYNKYTFWMDSACNYESNSWNVDEKFEKLINQNCVKFNLPWWQKLF